MRAAIALCTSLLALGLLGATATVAGTIRTGPLSKGIVAANLKRAVPGFRAFLHIGTCHGTRTVAHCVVVGSIGNDAVNARVTIRLTNGTLRDVDQLSLTAGMGGGTTHKRYYGTIT